MQSSAIIEVAIGLVLTWLIMSVATSQIQELIVEAIWWRSTFLKIQIRNMFHGQDDLVNRFYNHALIQALHTNGFLWLRRKPVEISKSTFARVALDVFLNLHHPSAKPSEEISASLLSAQDLVDGVKRSMNYLGLRNDPQRQALLKTIKSLAPTLDTEGFELGGKLEETLKNIEDWFESTMERASRIYRKYAAFFALIIGLLLAYNLNVDSIYITKQLWVQPTLREAIVAQASNLAPGDEVGLGSTISKINSLPIPVGWSAGNIPQDQNGMLLLYSGWFITGLAAAQGASFWFDILKRLSGLRSQPSESSAPVG
jgi:hypothetical protein